MRCHLVEVNDKALHVTKGHLVQADCTDRQCSLAETRQWQIWQEPQLWNTMNNYHKSHYLSTDLHKSVPLCGRVFLLWWWTDGLVCVCESETLMFLLTLVWDFDSMVMEQWEGFSLNPVLWEFSPDTLASSHPKTCFMGWLMTLSCPLCEFLAPCWTGERSRVNSNFTLVAGTNSHIRCDPAQDKAGNKDGWMIHDFQHRHELITKTIKVKKVFRQSCIFPMNRGLYLVSDVNKNNNNKYVLHLKAD